MFYGIDLGTTNSCVTYVDGAQVKVVVNSNSQQTTRSLVFFESAENHVVGDAADNCFELNPSAFVEGIKREMTAEYTHPTSSFPYGFTPTEISAKILRHLVDDANKQERLNCNDVVITVPARFDSAAKNRTRDAARIAGLNVLCLVSEPTAAVAGYRDMLIRRGELPRQGEKILVFDLGGGTFDISICDISKDVLRVVLTGGDERLGGRDWDKALARYIVNDLLGGNYDNLTKGEKLFALRAAAKAKEALTDMPLAPIRNLSISCAIGKGSSLRITRDKFNNLTHELCMRAMSKLHETLERLKSSASLGVEDIDEVLLVGGSTYMPQIQDELAKIFGRDKLKQYQPELIVAMGASVYNRIREEESNGGLVQTICDVVGHTYGFELTRVVEDRQYIENLIFANKSTPAESEITCCTRYDNQTAVAIRIWESDSLEQEIELSCAKLISSDSELALPGNLPKDTNIKVKFSVDKSSVLHVKAYLESDSSYNTEFDVKLLGSMSGRDVESAKKKLGNDVGMG